jgi:Predicted nucleotide-binding protein containing TIR-like domain
MERAKRVYVSVPRDNNLDERQRVLKHAILDKLRSKGLEPQEFQVSGLPLRSPYTFDAVRDIMSRCHGALILAFARWRDPSGGEGVAMPTVWNHFEGAFALALKKEILVIREKNVAGDGITWDGGGQIVLGAPDGAGPEWLETAYAKTQIDAWIDAVKRINDVFLAYSSKARATANDIAKFLSSRGVSVRDWEIDFAPGSTILDELMVASKSCLGAIMLLTKDDEFFGEENFAAPRDNVIFETGLFMEAKGRERVLVVREQGAKMPADIGGGIYLGLRDRNDITPIQTKLLDFIEKRI